MRPGPTILMLVCLGIGFLGGIRYLGAPLPIEAPSPRGAEIHLANDEKARQPGFLWSPRLPAVPPKACTLLWQSLDSSDLKRLIGNLRAVECPEETIRDIVLARVGALFAEKERLARFKLEGPPQDWASRLRLTEADLKWAKEWRALQMEKRALLKETLGVYMPLDVLPSTHARNYEDCQAAIESLPESKRDIARELKERYWQASDALKESYKDRPHVEYVEAYRRLNQQHEEDLKSVLSPREFDEFMIRTSVTGTSLAKQLADFEPTEEELRSIFHIVRRYEEQTGRVGGQYGMVDVDDGRRAAVHEDKAQELRSALGEARYAEYERSQDKAYRDLAWVARCHGLPSEVAVQAYQLERAYRENLSRLEADLNGQEATPIERERLSKEMLAGLRDAQARILGEEAAGSYRRILSAAVRVSDL